MGVGVGVWVGAAVGAAVTVAVGAGVSVGVMVGTDVGVGVTAGGVEVQPSRTIPSTRRASIRMERFESRVYFKAFGYWLENEASGED